MKKLVSLHPAAEKELNNIEKEEKLILIAGMKKLERDGFLRRPDGDKLDSILSEIRVPGGQARAIFAYVGERNCVILKVFIKKRNDIPTRHKKTALKRLKTL